MGRRLGAWALMCEGCELACGMRKEVRQTKMRVRLCCQPKKPKKTRQAHCFVHLWIDPTHSDDVRQRFRIASDARTPNCQSWYPDPSGIRPAREAISLFIWNGARSTIRCPKTEQRCHSFPSSPCLTDTEHRACYFLTVSCRIFVFRPDRASALRTTAVHLAGGSCIYKTRSLLFVHLTCL